MKSISIFIPIRKNSKRVKNKNIRYIPGFNFGLTELKIKQMEKLKRLFNKNSKVNLEFIVSTDCTKVQTYLRKFKWIKVYKRKKSLATDDSLEKLIKYVPSICVNKYILWTHVTSPLFNEVDYKNFIESFFKFTAKIKISKSAFSADIIQKFILDNKGKWVSHNYKKKKMAENSRFKKILFS